MDMAWPNLIKLGPSFVSMSLNSTAYFFLQTFMVSYLLSYHVFPNEKSAKIWHQLRKNLPCSLEDLQWPCIKIFFHGSNIVIKGKSKILIGLKLVNGTNRLLIVHGHTSRCPDSHRSQNCQSFWPFSRPALSSAGF